MFDLTPDNRVLPAITSTGPDSLTSVLAALPVEEELPELRTSSPTSPTSKTPEVIT
jgi:hypothetical protein